MKRIWRLEVLFVCFLLCTTSYGIMAVQGYLMFGQAAKSQITLNLPVGKLSSKIAIYTTLITPLTKYALIVTPILNAIEERLQVSKNRIIGTSIRTLLVISTLIVALAVPFFSYVVALTGAFLSSSATIVLPGLCYIKIFKNERRWGVEEAIVLGIMAMGASIGVIGTYVSMKQIITSL